MSYSAVSGVVQALRTHLYVSICNTSVNCAPAVLQMFSICNTAHLYLEGVESICTAQMRISRMWLAQALQEFEARLADRQDEAQARERENENLEGQVEQLTISLMDATSKKTDSELRLRQFQQVRCWLCLPTMLGQIWHLLDRHLATSRVQQVSACTVSEPGLPLE